MLLHKPGFTCTSQASSCSTNKFLEHGSTDAWKCPCLKGSMQTRRRRKGGKQGLKGVDERADETEN